MISPSPAANTAFDVARVREDFPILDQRIYGKPLVYLDNAATSQKPRQVIETLVRYYSEYNANIHRGVHFLSQRASEAYDGVREKVRKFIRAASAREIVFVRGATEGINLVASSFLRGRLAPGDQILISAMEHHSNIVPWQMLCEEKNAVLKVIPMKQDGSLDMDALPGLLTPSVKMISVVHTSNSLGTINPVKEITRMARAMKIPVMVDAAQAAAHEPLDVQDLDCDFLVFSGHKMLGPTGAGVLYGRASVLESMPPYQGGGDMITAVTFEKTTYHEIPFRFEAGTQNVADVIAMGAAIDYWDALDRHAVALHEKELLQHAAKSLGSIPGVVPVGTAGRKASVVSFRIDGVNALDMGMYLDTQGIAIRTGHHCTQPVMDYFGIPGTLRASFLFYNTAGEIDALAGAVRRGMSILQKG